MKWTAFLITVLVSSSARAQSDTIPLLPVEVTAVRASERAPFTKNTLTKAQIEKQNWGQDLPFVLADLPAVVVHSDAGNAVGYTGIRIRGTDATRVNVTLNGIPFNDAEGGGTFFVNLPDFLSSVNSIQVQRGVGTSSNGGSSFGASINLSTNDLIKERSYEINNSFGSFNTWKNTVKVNSGLIDDRFIIDARLSRISSNGYIDRAASNLRSYYLSGAWVGAKSSLRFTTFSGKEKTYQAWYGVAEKDLASSRRMNSAGTEKPGSPYENETDNYTQTHYQLFFNQQLAPHLVFNTGLFFVKGKGFYEQYKADEKYGDYGLPNAMIGSMEVKTTDLIRQLWLNNGYYGDVFSFNYNKAGTVITLGGAITQYNGDHYGRVTWAKNGLTAAKRWYDVTATKSDANMYAKWQQNLTASLQVYTDLQWRRINYKLNGFRNNPDLNLRQRYNFFNPKIGLSYVKNEWSGYASFGVGNKEPNRDDFETAANQQPKAERLHDVELGFQQKKQQYSWGATLYHMRYKDQLVLTGKLNDVGAYTRTNVDDSYRQGVELQAGMKVSSWLRFNGNLALSRNRLKNFNEYIDDYDLGIQKLNTYSETDISFSPAVVSAATLTVSPISNLDIALISKFVSKQYLDNTSNDNRSLAAYFTQNVGINYSFSQWGLKNIGLSLNLINVFNQFYEPNGYTFSYYNNNQLNTENFYFPMAGFNAVMGVNVKL